MTRALPLVLLALAACSGPRVYVRGVPNLALVTDGIYRSGQPEDWRGIQELGITDVIKLNHAQAEAPDNPPSGIRVHYFPIQPTTSVVSWFASLLGTEIIRPDADTLAAIHRIISDARRDRRIILIHCVNGHDRTGLLAGMSLVWFEGWTKEAAFNYMLTTGFHKAHIGLMRAWWDFDPKEYQQ
jgi:hypothetical protein